MWRGTQHFEKTPKKQQNWHNRSEQCLFENFCKNIYITTNAPQKGLGDISIRSFNQSRRCVVCCCWLTSQSDVVMAELLSQTGFTQARSQACTFPDPTHSVSTLILPNIRKATVRLSGAAHALVPMRSKKAFMEGRKKRKKLSENIWDRVCLRLTGQNQHLICTESFS